MLLKICFIQLGYITTDGASNMVSAFKYWDDIYSLDKESEINDDNDNPTMEPTVDDQESDESDIENETDDEQIFDEEIRCPGVEIVGERHRIHCFAHALQLVVKDAFSNCNEAKKILESVRKIVEFFFRSNHWRIRLKTLIGKDLIQPAATRWNIYYYVLKRLSEARLII
jgi:hypothetical protein